MQVNELIITASTLRNWLMCERRVWLDQQGDPALRQAVATPYAEAGIAHEDQISDAVFGRTAPVPTTSWAEAVQLTRDAMQQGIAAIRGAAFGRSLLVADQSITVRGKLDWVRRMAQASILGRWSYQPIEIKLRREATEADRLQLDLYLWLLEGEQGSEVTGELWLGVDRYGQPLTRLEHSFRPDALAAAFERTASITVMDAPPIYLTGHCQTCHWHHACQHEAKAQRAVTLLPGLTRQTWEQMHAAGIVTLDQVLIRSQVELMQLKGVGKAKAQEFQTYAESMVQNRPIQRERLPDSVTSPGIMLDLETRMDGSEGVPWCFGWQVAGEPYRVAIVAAYFDGESLQLPDGAQVIIVPDSDAGWRSFAAAAQAVSGPIYHWTGFELSILRATAPTDVIEAVAARFHDLHKTFKRSYALPIKGTSIKTVGAYFDFEWPPGSSAWSAWVDYQAWLLDGDQDALVRSIAYNRADVEAMDVIWRWMNQVHS
jgi:predicted RecB family nuclease